MVCSCIAFVLVASPLVPFQFRTNAHFLIASEIFVYQLKVRTMEIVSLIYPFMCLHKLIVVSFKCDELIPLCIDMGNDDD